jgi:tRNA nucleotidyltransferase (CCA-adding enzyme)
MLATVGNVHANGSRGLREDLRVDIPSASELLEQVRSLPAGGPLLCALGDAPGVYLVGGAVRDLLLGGRPLDLDLVVEGDAAAAASRIGDELVVHDRFGTSTVSSGGFTYDVARARRERYPSPGALPEVEPAGIDEDLLRRDFTVNAIAVALDGEHPGAVRAAPGALEDLDAGQLRVLHDRSFIDDPTRLLRLARYASRLGFQAEPATRALARAAVDDGALTTVSGPRIGAELILLAREPDPVAALSALHELAIDRAIHPSLGLIDEPLARRAIALLPADGRRDRLVLAAAARAVPGEELGELLDALAFEAGDRDAIVSAASGAPELARRLAHAARPSEIARAARGAGPEAVALAGALGPEEPARRWLDRLRQVELEIDGGDLLEAGVPEGPAIGRGLAAALAAKLDGAATGRDAELAVALRAAEETG